MKKYPNNRCDDTPQRYIKRGNKYYIVFCSKELNALIERGEITRQHNPYYIPNIVRNSDIESSWEWDNR